MNKERAYAFHQWSITDISKLYEVDYRKGLSEQKVHFRLEKNGFNSIDEAKESNFLTIFLRQISNFFIILLFVAAIISFFTEGILETVILLAIIIINIALGFYQEFKAEKALNKLKDNFKSKTKVLRDGEMKVVDSDNITLGDVVILEAGDKVPADLRIIEEESLRIDESSLTGESLPVSKNTEILPIDTPLADRKNLAFGSTVVVGGRGRGVVIAIGKSTEFGKIAGLVNKPEEKSPLENRILYLGKILTLLTILLVTLIFILGIVKDYDTLYLFKFCIALLVGAVPESLPTIITLSLAIGVSKMAQRKAITRRLAVVEALGAVNIIATDKTGTLTNNKLEVSKVAIWNDKKITTFDYDVKLGKNDNVANLFLDGVACSNISMVDSKEFIGDPVEVAIGVGAKTFQKALILKSKKIERLAEIPFDSDKKFMSVTVRTFSGKKIIAKGATEKILSFCSLSKEEKRKITKESDSLSSEGLKVIAICSKNIGKNSNSSLKSMKFLGLFGLIDMPKEGVKEAIEKTMVAGIRPIMITGDHPQTARFVANKIGLKVSDDEVIEGKQIDNLCPKDLKTLLEKVKIFARVTPENKIQIVKTLQQYGYSVAVTGDGVNDAPALKEATVGISMGTKGTDVANDSSDIVLSDDEYGTIVSAVEYGRAIYDNIRNAVTFFLSGNFDELFLIAFAFIADLPLPLIALQVLWINIITDSLPALSLAFESPSQKVLKQKPRSSSVGSMKHPIIYALMLSAVTFSFGLFLYLWGLEHSVDKARTLVFTYSVFAELVFIFSIRSNERIWQNVRSFFANRFMIVAILISLILQLSLFIEPISQTFGVVKLNNIEIIFLTVSTVLSFIIAEIIRFIYDKKILKN